MEYTRYDFIYSSQNITRLSEQSVHLNMVKRNINLQQMPYI